MKKHVEQDHDVFENFLMLNLRMRLNRKKIQIFMTFDFPFLMFLRLNLDVPSVCHSTNMGVD
jgi:hypothetical protein